MPVLDHNQPVLVVGAGIGGLTAALALARHNIPVEVYERRSDRTVELAGTGMTIWSNATTALRSLGLGEALLDDSAVIRRARHFSSHDKVVFETAIDEMEWPGSTPSVSIARGALIRLLLAACEEGNVPVHFGQSCTGLVDAPDGVRLTFADGSTVDGACVVGADGTRSTIRSLLTGDVDARYYGISVWRGMSPASASVEDGVAHMFQTKRRDGLAGMAWHVGDGRVAWTIGRKAPADSHDGDGAVRAHLLELLSAVEGPPSRWVETTDERDIIRVDLFERPWSDTWGLGRVTLLGDAAHAMPTVLGQGACQAIEDGVVLADAIALAIAEHDDITTALREYEQKRIERVHWVRQQVDRLARMQQLSNPMALAMRDAAARIFAPRMQPAMWRGLLRPPADAIVSSAAGE